MNWNPIIIHRNDHHHRVLDREELGGADKEGVDLHVRLGGQIHRWK